MKVRKGNVGDLSAVVEAVERSGRGGVALRILGQACKEFLGLGTASKKDIDVLYIALSSYCEDCVGSDLDAQKATEKAWRRLLAASVKEE